MVNLHCCRKCIHCKSAQPVHKGRWQHLALWNGAWTKRLRLGTEENCAPTYLGTISPWRQKSDIKYIWVFSKVDHSGNYARFLLEQNKFSKKATTNRVWALDPMTVLFTVSCLINCANSQVLIERSLTPLLLVHQLTFGLKWTERI